MKNKKNRRKRSLSIFAIVIILFLLTTTLITLKIFYPNIKINSFSIESRLKNLEKANKIEDSTNETIGWLRVGGTNIDYPIIHYSYLDSNYSAIHENFGWSLNEDFHFHKSITIIGHNIFNLSSTPKIKSDKFKRFEALMAFIYYDFANENRYIQYTIDGKDYLYKIFSVDLIPASNKMSYPIDDDYSSENMIDHISMLQENSLFDYSIDVNEKDSIISVITCTRFYGSDDKYEFLVNGRLLRDGEKDINYKIKKNRNYDKIEKILKGDEINEEDSF